MEVGAPGGRGEQSWCWRLSDRLRLPCLCGSPGLSFHLEAGLDPGVWSGPFS